MPSGGARTRSGPPPNPDALARERDEGEWVVLPATGRPGRAPKWPLDGGATTREKQVWKKLWGMPQAFMWERLRQEDQVAVYVRRFVESEKPGAAHHLCTLVRQMADSLGLTTPGLRSNRWKVEKVETQGAEVVSAATSARDRLKVVNDGGT